jgi:hypothetical protein
VPLCGPLELSHVLYRRILKEGIKVLTHESEVCSAEGLPTVDPSEIAFAMALFVAAAKGQVYASDIGSSGFPLADKHVEFFDDWVESEQGSPGAFHTSSVDMPLSRALSVLWYHYNGDVRQRAIWSRVVAFHAMMVGRLSSSVEEWSRPYILDAGKAFLDPAVVNAVAAAPLIEFGQFSDTLFRALVEHFTVCASTPTGLSISHGCQELPRFRIFEKIWGPVESFSGRRAFESMLSRALTASSSEFPWLSSAQLGPDGSLEGIGTPGQPVPSAAEAAAGEVAVVRSLIGLLRVILGEGVTVRLLESVYPGAFSETWGAAIAVAGTAGLESGTVISCP